MNWLMKGHYIYTLLLLASLFWIIAVTGCTREHYPNPADERFGVLDLVYSDPYRGRWEQGRAAREAACRAAIEAQYASPLRFTFDSTDDVRGWKEYGNLEPLSVAGGDLYTRSNGAGAIAGFDAERASELLIELSVDAGGRGVFLWRTVEEQFYSGRKSRDFHLIGDGRFHTYRIQLTDALGIDPDDPKWSGIVNAIRLDFMADVGEISLRRIEFLKGPGRKRILEERLRHGTVDHVSIAGKYRLPRYGL